MFAKSLGGRADGRNLIALADSLNQKGGAYYTAEEDIRTALKALPKAIDTLTVEFTPVYSAAGEAFLKKVKMNGGVFTVAPKDPLPPAVDLRPIAIKITIGTKTIRLDNKNKP